MEIKFAERTVELSSSWPYLEEYREIVQRLLDQRQSATDSG